MLYQWEVGRGDPDEVMRTYWPTHGPEPPLSARGRDFAETLVRGTIAHLPTIDPLVAAGAEHWRLERMALVDRLILRLAVYELLHEAATPPAVAINEAIELARTFSTDESVSFVNGVLDGIRKRLEADPSLRST
jgi:N utilization substance protein B